MAEEASKLHSEPLDRLDHARLPSSKQALVFLTHRNSDRVHRHFERLRHELVNTMPAFICLHRPAQEATLPSWSADFIVEPSDADRLLPRRYGQMRSAGSNFRGFTDLCYMPALRSPKLNQFEFFWIMEDDVDFSGNWSTFFNWAMGSSADVICTYLARWSPGDSWVHWGKFSTPPNVLKESWMRGFYPLCRFSRRSLDVYADEVERPGWSGHFEAVYGTVASHHGLQLAAISSASGEPDLGPFPFSAESSHRVATIDTFNAEPFVGTSYFHEDEIGFRIRNYLYHPIKVGAVDSNR